MMRAPAVDKYLRECRAAEKAARSQREPSGGSRLFAAVSANLFNLMPSLPVGSHASAAAHITVGERLAVVDQRHFNAIVPHVCSNGDRLDMSRGPAIFCSYHLGPYRTAIPFLVGQGVELTVVADKNVVKQQGALFQDLMVRFCKDHDLPVENCQWRDTSEGTLLLSLVRDLRKGRSIFFYVDGNTSVNGDIGARHKNAVPVDFMGARLFAKAGVATLAYMTKSRIVPIVMKRDLDAHDPISADVGPPYEWMGDDRPAYVADACSWMWKILEAEIADNPFVWEPWRYVHRFIDLDGFERSEAESATDDVGSLGIQDLKFDSERFAVAGAKKENYLFDRRLYKFYPISEDLRGLLDGLKRADPAKASIDDGLLAKLRSMRVLVESKADA